MHLTYSMHLFRLDETRAHFISSIFNIFNEQKKENSLEYAEYSEYAISMKKPITWFRRCATTTKNYIIYCFTDENFENAYKCSPRFCLAAVLSSVSR